MNEGKRGVQPLRAVVLPLSLSLSFYWETSRSCVVRTETASRTGKNGYLIKFTGTECFVAEAITLFRPRVLALRVSSRAKSLALPLSLSSSPSIFNERLHVTRLLFPSLSFLSS